MTAHDDIIHEWTERPGRHIVNLSGGKDSTALAIFLRGKIPQVEYLFCDTHKELPETYEYLDRLAAYLQRPIIRLNAQRGFDHWLDMYGGMLPSARVRWCTRKLKIEPFEDYISEIPMTAHDDIIHEWTERPGRHIVNLSGGKDSTALAIFLRGKIPQVEYLFCDTHKELPETYEYLDRLAAYLQRPIIRLNAQRGFDHWLDMYGGMLPSARVRWCTRKLKIEPFEDYIGDDTVWSYVGIRADEARSGYVSTKPNIHPLFPFKEFGLGIADVERLLETSGLGLPSYYEWRQRSGCYFCFFQRTGEWVGLKERHPELFELAKDYETARGGEQFSWRQRETLAELEQPERVAQAKRNHQIRLEVERKRRPDRPLIDLVGAALDSEDDDQGCDICHL